MALAAATTVSVLTSIVDPRWPVAAGFVLLVMAGVIVTIEQPGWADSWMKSPTLKDHLATAAFLLLGLGVTRLTYEEIRRARPAVGKANPVDGSSSATPPIDGQFQ